MLLSSGLIVYGPLQSQKLDPGRPFMWHPILMGLGFNFMLSVGVWLYRYEDVDVEVLDERAYRRKWHVCIQLIGVLLVGAGFAAIYYAHERSGSMLLMVSNDPVVGFGKANIYTRTAHCLLGYVILILLATQVILGTFRYKVTHELEHFSTESLEDEVGRCSIHEKMGKVVYVFGLTNVLLGVWQYDVWTLFQRIVITLATITTAVLGPRWDGEELETPGKAGVNLQQKMDRERDELEKKRDEELALAEQMGRKKEVSLERA